jgi:hypothetical protein
MSEPISVATLLPDAAQKPLDRNQTILAARGLKRPDAGTVQRLAIEVCKAKGWS